MNAFFAAYAAVQCALVVWLARRGRAWSLEYLLLLLIVVGLCFDNVMLTIGNALGEGEVLRSLSYPRHALHVALPPMLPAIATRIAGDTGLTRLRTPALRALGWTTSAGLLAWAYAAHLHGLELSPSWEQGVLSYASGNASAPFFIIAANVYVLIVGIALWRATGARTLAASAGFMLGVGSLHTTFGTPMTNFGELVFAAGLCWAAVRSQLVPAPSPAVGAGMVGAREAPEAG